MPNLPIACHESDDCVGPAQMSDRFELLMSDANPNDEQHRFLL